MAMTKPARLYISDPILAEYKEVLARRELRIRKGLQQQLLQLITSRAHHVIPSHWLQVTVDPADQSIPRMRTPRRR